MLKSTTRPKANPKRTQRIKQRIEQLMNIEYIIILEEYKNTNLKNNK